MQSGSGMAVAGEAAADGWATTDTGLDDPIDRAVAALRRVDAEMAVVLRAVAEAGPRDGLPARRQVALLARATGVDVGFVDRAVQVLAAMPRTQQAFDDGLLSWSQVRGIVLEARRLPVAQRQVLDDALAGTITESADDGEPDRVVEVCGDLVARLDVEGQQRDEESAERQQRLVMQFGFDGWADVHGSLEPVAAATTAAALDAAADAPVTSGAPVPTDDDGRPLPRSARKPTSRAWQWAVGLERIAAAFLGGRGAADDESPVDPELDPDGDAGGSRGTGRARPTVVVVAPLAELIGVDLEADSVTARLLLRRGSGRRRITRALARALADDADVVALFTDDDGMPVAIGDSHSPITPAMRRAVIARDQGCRAPGCSVPAEHCDVHHIIPREQGGATAVHNLALHCRHDNLAAHRHRWRQTLLPDGTLRTTIGRRTYVTRPRLRPPPTGGDPRGDRGGPGPDPPMPGRPDPAGAASTSTLPF